MTGSRPAKLLDDGSVILTPRGAQLVLAALELARRARQARDGDAAVSADFAWIYDVCRIAAGSFPPATSGRTVQVVMPSSDATVTVAEAASILGVTPQAVRKSIKAGRLTARRHGSAWMLSEIETRQAAVGRQANGRVRRSAGEADERHVPDDQPGA